MPNHRPIFIFPSGERHGNGEVYATKEEAESSAKARFMVWTMPTDWSTDETDDPVTGHWDRESNRRVVA